MLLSNTLQSFVLHHCLHSPGLYSSQAELICTSVSAEIFSFCVTSSAAFLVLLSTVVRLSSSAREPLVLVSRNKRLSSKSLILLLFIATSSMRFVLSLSSSWLYLENRRVINNKAKIKQGNSVLKVLISLKQHRSRGAALMQGKDSSCISDDRFLILLQNCALTNHLNECYGSCLYQALIQLEVENYNCFFFSPFVSKCNHLSRHRTLFDFI